MSVFAALTALAKHVQTGSGTIETQKFLEVCKHVIVVVEKFGTSFVMIKSDINGNIERLETASQKDPQRFSSLFEIILDEVGRGEQGGKYSDARALLWLKRSVTLSAAASAAYYETLYKFHTWYTSAAFQLALKLVPSRENFFEKLEATSEEAMSEMHAFLRAFNPILTTVNDFLKAHNLDDPTPV